MAPAAKKAESSTASAKKKTAKTSKTTAKRKKTLVIVESPSKAKTIGRFLGSNYKVVASVGHVRDLPKSKFGIDIDNDFEPEYINIRGKGDVIKELKKEAKSASKVYLATDPDREGEAISWHLAFILGIDPQSECRIVFNEITQKTIKEAIKHPRPINLRLVDAQQARRVLDRLVGYQISPLLWRKVRRGLSAGRVQSAALKIICDREREILGFTPEEYWNIIAKIRKGKTFNAKLAACDGKKIEVKNEEQAKEIVSELEKGTYTVASVEEKEKKRRPYAPFTTSTMQQDASNKLNFNARKTMFVAQQLYEGVTIKGQGTVGLISYIRTDSVRISDDAKAAAAEYITSNFGKEYLGSNSFSNKKKEIQDAHEAIRPTRIELAPDQIKDSLTPEQFKLYSLVWSRFIASQMKPAVYNSVTAVINNGRYDFRATGSTLIFDGFHKVYGSDDNSDKELPPLEKGEVLKNVKIIPEQNFTQPPSRYTEASLVRTLEESNIGRPSTYAPIISTLSDRKYITIRRKTIAPTDLGFTVNDMVCEYFKQIVDAGFTAQMEDRLDDIEINNTEWKKVVGDFYGPFEKELKIADESIEKVEIEDKPTGETCEVCGRPLVLKHGRFGDFIACSGYPECKNTKPIIEKTGVKCPTCGKDIIKRKSKRGKTFYGCSGYPDCSQVYWYEPVEEKCPQCGSLLVKRKGKGTTLACSNEECRFRK